ncbi:MAG: SCE4755 family polysaccharide monooxygenase-like protein [Polyangia bacterium]
MKSALTCALVLVGLAVALPADAHFVLDAPPSWMSQDSLGSPQKGPPCGDEGGGTVTSIVTTYRQGDTITITIDEKIFHPGHYRVSLATTDRSVLLNEPVVQPDSNSVCGSAEIQSTPVFPVLADNVLPHTTAFSGPQTVTIQLPADVTCDKCTLQVLEFMSNHGLNTPGGCFYHHCADLQIVAAVDGVDMSVSPTDASISPGTGTDASVSVPPATKKSSGCSMGVGAPIPGALVLALLGLCAVLVRRRRA